jgi:hypothetical protein
MSDHAAGDGTDGNAGAVVRTVVTVALLLAFGALVVVMMINADRATEIVWNRGVYLLGGVEALVFTSVGWMFGKEVHRSEAKTAKDDAAQSKRDATQAYAEATAKGEEAAVERTKGRAVKAFARNVVAPSGRDSDDGAQPVGLGGGQAPAATPPGGLLGMVEELWPD